MQKSRDRPMPGSFPAPPNIEGKSPGNEVEEDGSKKHL